MVTTTVTVGTCMGSGRGSPCPSSKGTGLLQAAVSASSRISCPDGLSIVHGESEVTSVSSDIEMMVLGYINWVWEHGFLWSWWVGSVGPYYTRDQLPGDRYQEANCLILG